MNSENITKDQHFVPRFYLKNFANKKGDLEVLKIKEERLSKPRPYQRLGYGYFFYAVQTGVPDQISQQVEDLFRPMEDMIAKHLPRIIRVIEGNYQITDEDKYIMSLLISMIWIRGPSMRSQISRFNNDMAIKIEKLRGEKPIEFSNINNLDHLKFICEWIGDNGGYANLFFGMKWKIYLAKGSEVFITSDSPVVEKWFPPKTAYGGGASFMEKTKYFALTPRILIEMKFPVGSSKTSRKSLYQDQSDTVKMFNMILISDVQKYAYSGERAILEGLLAGKKNPGRNEVEYYTKYEFPWIEFRRKMAGKVYISD